MSEPHFDLVVLGGGLVGLWTAREAARQGARVAVVEVGPATLAEQRDAAPPVHFAARENLGATRARNHVLTGNSSYWGGALVRNPPAVLAELYGADAGAAVEQEYPSIEQALGVREGFEPGELMVRDRRLHEVAVLPGKRRGLWADFREPGVTCFTACEITGVSFGHGGRLDRLTLRDHSDEERQIIPRNVSLSMGVIDSNLFAQRWLAPVMPESVRSQIGTRLHDHWSIPVAALEWRVSPTLEPLFPPKFRAGVVAGRRLALECGFFHIVADLDSMPPYDRVKTFMKTRQKGAGPLALFGAAAATMASPFSMARAGIHYLAHRELHIPDGSHVLLYLDFESAQPPDNRVVATRDGATLHWDLREDDYSRFVEILQSNRDWWEGTWSAANVPARWLADDWTHEGLRRHLGAHAIDAYHMGGGLRPEHRTTTGVCEPDGSVRGCPNVFVNGTAFLCRPGPANPVLTLLARAMVFVRSLSKGTSPS
jgi:hypothetical protein